MSWKFVFVVLAMWPAGALAGDDSQNGGGSFEGNVIVEWLDDPYVLKLRLVKDFAFREPGGQTWVVPVDAVVDGRSLPTLFVNLLGRPFESTFRKSALVYDYAAKSKERSWKEAQHMFYVGSVAEGVIPVEAKVMYMLLSAKGLRWEVRGSRDCYGRCHTSDADLQWSPKVRDDEVVALVSWVRTENPSLEGIEKRVDRIILEASPHMIGRIHAVPEQ